MKIKEGNYYVTYKGEVVEVLEVEDYAVEVMINGDSHRISIGDIVKKASKADLKDLLSSKDNLIQELITEIRSAKLKGNKKQFKVLKGYKTSDIASYEKSYEFATEQLSLAFTLTAKIPREKFSQEDHNRITKALNKLINENNGL